MEHIEYDYKNNNLREEIVAQRENYIHSTLKTATGTIFTTLLAGSSAYFAAYTDSDLGVIAAGLFAGACAIGTAASYLNLKKDKNILSELESKLILCDHPEDET